MSYVEQNKRLKKADFLVVRIITEQKGKKHRYVTCLEIPKKYQKDKYIKTLNGWFGLLDRRFLDWFYRHKKEEIKSFKIRICKNLKEKRDLEN